jgi:hypothetical protein
MRFDSRPMPRSYRATLDPSRDATRLVVQFAARSLRSAKVKATAERSNYGRTGSIVLEAMGLDGQWFTIAHRSENGAWL